MQPPPFTIEEFVKNAKDSGIDCDIDEEDSCELFSQLLSDC